MDDKTNDYILVMEYASGGNLEQFITKFPLDAWLRVWQIAKVITRRLQVLHKLGLIHNDLHPRNIMFMEDDAGTDPVITDIVTSITVEQVDYHDHNRGVYGWTEYLPPEAFKKAGVPYTQKSDIYCLGTLLWQLTAPFTPRNTAESPPSSAPSGLREIPIPGTLKVYEDIYKKCWNIDPEKRPTVDQVLDYLEGIEMNVTEEKRWLSESPEAREYLEEVKREGNLECSSPSGNEGSNLSTSISRYHTQNELQNLSVQRLSKE